MAVYCFIVISNQKDTKLTQVKESSEDRAYRLIADALVHFYKPGDYLYESTLTHELNMSRTPISIALNRLVAEGLLKKQPKKGCFIPQINLKDAQDVFRTRKVLEEEAVRLLVKQQNESSIDKLAESVEKATMAVRLDDFETFYKEDLAFHKDLVDLCNNTYLIEAWKRVFMRCNMYTSFFNASLKENQFYKENILQDHHEIVEAIRNFDEAHALSCVDNHFENIVNYAVNNTMKYDSL